VSHWEIISGKSYERLSVKAKSEQPLRTTSEVLHLKIEALDDTDWLKNIIMFGK
jgi:hypothetical protein